MPKPTNDPSVVDIADYRPLRVPERNVNIDWMSVPEIDTMVSMLASEDSEGLSDFMALDTGESLTLNVEITDTRLAQAVLHSIRMQESLIPGMQILGIKFNQEKD